VEVTYDKLYAEFTAPSHISKVRVGHQVIDKYRRPFKDEVMIIMMVVMMMVVMMMMIMMVMMMPVIMMMMLRVTLLLVLVVLDAAPAL